LQLFLQDIVNGLLTGGILALVALGFSLVWGIMNIINLAHGTFVLLGAYVTYQLFVSLHVDPFLSLPIAFVALFVLGYGLQWYVINAVVRAPVLTTFLLTFGLSLLIVNVILLVWHGDTRSVTTAYSGANFTVGGVTVPIVKLLTLCVALVITFLANAWMTGTKTGRAIRATSMDVGAAQLTGVKVARVYALVFALGAGLGGAAGSLISVSFAFSPSSGDAFLIKGFIVCVLGGLGSVPGAMIGGLVYGIVETFASQYIGTGYADAVALLVLLLVLIFRPTGLLGKATA
jgi:branched-chain amino acid transport system permease protein